MLFPHVTSRRHSSLRRGGGSSPPRVWIFFFSYGLILGVGRFLLPPIFLIFFPLRSRADLFQPPPPEGLSKIPSREHLLSCGVLIPPTWLVFPMSNSVVLDPLLFHFPSSPPPPLGCASRSSRYPLGLSASLARLLSGRLSSPFRSRSFLLHAAVHVVESLEVLHSTFYRRGGFSHF